MQIVVLQTEKTLENVGSLTWVLVLFRVRETLEVKPKAAGDYSLQLTSLIHFYPFSLATSTIGTLTLSPWHFIMRMSAALDKINGKSL